MLFTKEGFFFGNTYYSQNNVFQAADSVSSIDRMVVTGGSKAHVYFSGLITPTRSDDPILDDTTTLIRDYRPMYTMDLNDIQNKYHCKNYSFVTDTEGLHLGGTNSTTSVTVPDTYRFQHNTVPNPPFAAAWDGTSILTLNLKIGKSKTGPHVSTTTTNGNKLLEYTSTDVYLEDTLLISDDVLIASDFDLTYTNLSYAYDSPGAILPSRLFLKFFLA